MTRRFFMTGALALAGSMILPVNAMADLINFNFLKKKGAVFPYKMTEQEWRERLGEKAFKIMRGGANEDAGTSPLLRERRKGVYACRGCAQPLFSSAAKTMTNDFPTFRQPIARQALGTSADFGIVLPRTEVHCSNCGSHLGYKFMPQSDAAAESWRYAINGASLSFEPL